MSEYEFVEFAGKNPKEYKCPKCKAVIKYAKFFGSDKKLLTTDGRLPWFDREKRPMSNTGWPTDPTTKQMHECTSQQLDEVNKALAKSETEIKRTDLLVNELDPNSFGMEARKKEVLFECAIMAKEEEWITDYLLSRGGSNPNPAKVGMWHKMIDERLRRTHETG